MGTRAATHHLPLLVAPVLPDNELFSVETIHYKLPTINEINASPNVTGGGEVGLSLSGAVNSLHISVRVSRVEMVNSTAIVCYGLGGEEIRVWNGVTARLSAAAPRHPFAPLVTSPARPSKSRAPSWRRSTWPRRRPSSSRLRSAGAD